jgi:hypothetical protein
MSTDLQSYVIHTSNAQVHEAISDLATFICEKHQNVQAVLAYGSALRDASPENTLIDYYVLTQTLDGVSDNALSRLLCRSFPPNVYYAETQLGGKNYRCKYAVLPTELLALRLKPTVANPYFWVRFAQPMQVIWTRDDLTRKRVQQLIIRAMETASAHAKQLLPNHPHTEQWTELFRQTYKTEFRPENSSRAAMIVNLQREHFETISKHAKPVVPSTVPWRLRRWQGKALSIARLLKAAFTFQGGADYAAWKIQRHSGVSIEISDWHRRHPILASIVLLPKLLRKGGLK